MRAWITKWFGGSKASGAAPTSVADLIRLIPAARAEGAESVTALAETLGKQGLSLLADGLPAQAALALEAAELLGFSSPHLPYNIALAYSRSGQAGAAQERFIHAQKTCPQDATADGYALRNLYALDGPTLAEHKSAALRWAKIHSPTDTTRFVHNPQGLKERLRVGLMSGRFRRHAVGFLSLSALEHLDPNRFELIFFSNDRYEDDYSARFKAIAAEWHQIDALDDAGAATLIHRQAVDILIDMGGHSADGRMGVVARQPAPLQVKWVGGQHGTTGVAAMHYFITDAVETPPGGEDAFVETIVRLPASYACYTPPPDAPDVNTLPAMNGDGVTFGCFNNVAKMTPRTIETWARILDLIPGSRLVLKHLALAESQTRDRLHADFSAHGIAPSRVDLRSPTDHTDHLRAYHDVDIALDPFPWSGCVTTCESLWMGVPVLTLPGDAFCHRHSASFLTTVGFADWIATSEDDYVERACAAANSLDSLCDLRAGLRERVRMSPLCDAPEFARAFERMLFEINGQAARP